MKLRCSKKRTGALTLVEVLVVLFLLAVLAAMFLPKLAAAKRHSGPSCCSFLKQIATGCFVWADDNNDKFPMQISLTNGGAMEAATAGDAAKVFQVMSNELSTPKILICPQDTEHTFATNWTTDFSTKHLSYFVGVDSENGDPQSLF
jgi:competence protein ComGC